MTPQLGQVPFREAIDFFRAKGMVLTDRWPELWQQQHQTAFTVAGVANMQMLADIRAAVDRAIANGTTLADFRKDFDQVIKTNGWTLRGTPGWRSRVIFETNIRTAYAAGRWAQIERLRDSRPFIKYSAILDGRTRPLHRQWNGTVLPVGDAWWNTHFPPNGWRCRCTVISLSARDVERQGLTVGPAPSAPPRQVFVEGRGTIDVPGGIDAGFGYNPGLGAAARQAEANAQRALAGAPAELAAAARTLLGAPVLPPVPSPLVPYAEWARDILAAGQADGTFRKVGVLSDTVVDAISVAGKRAIDPDVVITSQLLLHLARESKRSKGLGISDADILRLPSIIQRPEAVLLDLALNDLLFVFSPTNDELGRGAKLVVHVNYLAKVREGSERFSLTFNAVKSGGLVMRETLQDAGQYRVIEGSV